jgi:hypothetical protein
MSWAGGSLGVVGLLGVNGSPRLMEIAVVQGGLR